MNDERRNRRLRIFLLFLLLGSILFIIIDSFTNQYIEKSSVSFIEWVRKNPRLGVLAVIIVYIVATVLFVPGSILTIGTGYAFGSAFDGTTQGVAMATMSVFIGAMLGSMCSFLLGRYLFRKWVLQLASHYKIFRALDRALETNGLKIMILLRLSPLIPYSALDYLSGLTSISFWTYSSALLAMIPGTILYCFIGATASSITAKGENESLKLVAMISGIAFALMGVILASYYSKIELKKMLQEEEEHEEGDSPTISLT